MISIPSGWWYLQDALIVMFDVAFFSTQANLVCRILSGLRRCRPHTAPALFDKAALVQINPSLTDHERRAGGRWDIRIRSVRGCYRPRPLVACVIHELLQGPTRQRSVV